MVGMQTHQTSDVARRSTSDHDSCAAYQDDVADTRYLSLMVGRAMALDLSLLLHPGVLSTFLASHMIGSSGLLDLF